MKPLAPNTLLQNRYKIVNLIGKGGMGEVYLAVDQRLGSAMALKRTTVGDDPMLAEAFEREAKTLANLRHPVLPKVSDHFSENDEQYLVMEHISGDDLSQRLKETKNPFPLNWVMFWADQLLEALTYLHTNNPPIIHRDIKPQNLKLTDDNHIVLLDFGLSKHALGQTRVTTSGSVVGYTPHYAPMEQIRGTGTSARSDVYSLSATLYQILTNTVPPDALTRADSLLANLPDLIKPIYELNSEVPASISDIIMQGMEISQEKRHKSARDMQKALRKAYNKMQSSMSAETVAFNMNDANVSEGIGDKTEVMSDLPPLPIEQATPEIVASAPLASEVTTPEVESADVSSMEKTEVIDASQIPQINNVDDMDATVQYNGEDIQLPQVNADDSGMKTEVLLDSAISSEIKSETVDNVSTNDDVSSIPSAIPIDEEFKTNDHVEVESIDEDFSTSDGFSTDINEGGFSPDETTPFIPLDEQNEADGIETKQNDTADFVSFESEKIDEDEQDKSATASFGLTENFSASDSVSEQTNQFHQESTSEQVEEEAVRNTATPAQATSSTGKYIAILGGLGVLLFLLLGTALGVGWYMYGGGIAGDNTNVAPTPQPSVASTPEVEPTADVVESNTIDETANTESNSEELANTESNTDSNSSDTNTVETTKTTDSTDSTSPTQTRRTTKTRTTPKPQTSQPRRNTTTRNTTTRTTTKKKNTTTATKPKTTTKKKKGKRTDIIQ